MLQNQWSPIYDVRAILTAISVLITDPNTQSPANTEASSLYKEDKLRYEQKVREIVELSISEEVNYEQEAKKQLEQEQKAKDKP